MKILISLSSVERESMIWISSFPTSLEIRSWATPVIKDSKFKWIGIDTGLEISAKFFVLVFFYFLLIFFIFCLFFFYLFVVFYFVFFFQIERKGKREKGKRGKEAITFF